MEVSQVLVVLFFLSACQCSFMREDLENRVVNALGRVLGFICENADEMNLDGLFGIVLAKAHLLKMCGAEDFSLSNQTSQILSQIRWEQKKLSQSYTTFKNFLFDPKVWKKNLEFTHGIVSPVAPISFEINTCDQYLSTISNACFPEKFSDKCLGEIINGSQKEGRKCFLNPDCLDYVVGSKCMLGYGITHKILLLQAAKALGCKWNAIPSIVNYCSHVLWEVRQNANCGFNETLDDLLLEQVAVLLCGSEGLLEFFEVRWVEHILSLQSRFGCFGMVEDGSVRKRREANTIKFGCMDHTTGLAAAVLSLFLRILKCSKRNAQAYYISK